MWFGLALICVAGWGFADLFYKGGSEASDRYSHLKITVWVGLVMGICSVFLLVFSGSFSSAKELLSSAVRYFPASLCYIASMIIGYAGLRYLEVSIVSPVQNASGALSMICMIVWFSFSGKIRSISEALSVPDIIGTAFIAGGMIFLAVVEQKLSDAKNAEKRYRYGALALIFPLLYCVFDTLGTAADGILLEGGSLEALSETDVLIVYGLTFLAAGIVAFFIIRAKTGSFYNPFAKTERPKAVAAVCEEFGQIFYVYAMAARPVLAAPMVASYCVVSVILGRVILKEKLKLRQYLCIFAVMAGIVMLGISEGLSS